MTQVNQPIRTEGVDPVEEQSLLSEHELQVETDPDRVIDLGGDDGRDKTDYVSARAARTDVDSGGAIDLNALVATTPPARKVVAIRIDQTTYDDAVGRIVKWAKNREARYVTVNSVNNVMTAHQDPAFAILSNDADLATPDGMPLVWTLRRLGLRNASRVCGPLLTPRIFDQAEEAGVPIGLYGGTPKVLDDLEGQISARWPRLEIAYSYSPPFRQLTESEDRKVVSDIVGSGARILFVGIGCPKQEVWMARHKADLPLVQVGVGAAFDLLAGHKRQAPSALQNNGLEWLYRLVCEPRRLWRRYMHQNPRFVWLVARQIMVTKRPPRPSRMQVRGVGSDRSR